VEVIIPKENAATTDDDHFDENDDFEEIETEELVLSQLDIEKFWQKFIDSHLAEKPRYASMLTSYSPILTDGNLVNVALESQLQADMFNEIKNDLAVFLRQKLGCKSINLSCEIIESDKTNAKMYTSEDKLKFLSQNNPNIVTLMKQLNLDFD